MSPRRRGAHIGACLAYVVGYPTLVALGGEFALFDFIMPRYSILELMTVHIPPELGLVQSVTYASCVRAGALCVATGAAYCLAPLAVVWYFVHNTGVGSDGLASPAHPRIPAFAHFAAYLALVPVVAYLAVPPVLGLVFHGGGGFTYIERWTHLPQIAVSAHVGYAVAALLATQHSIRAGRGNSARGLLDATRTGNIEATLEHLAAGVDPNTVRDASGATPLHVAATVGDVELIDILLEAGADPTARTRHGRTPLDVATTHGHTEAAAALHEDAHWQNAREQEKPQ